MIFSQTTDISCKIPGYSTAVGVPRAPRGESFDSGNKVFIHASEKQHGRPPVLAAARSEARRRYDWGTHCHSLGVPKRLADDIAMTWHIFLVAVPPRRQYQCSSGAAVPFVLEHLSIQSNTPSRATAKGHLHTRPI